MSILNLYCAVDDFWQEFGPDYQAHLITKGRKQRNRQAEMAPSAIMTLLMRFHQSH